MRLQYLLALVAFLGAAWRADADVIVRVSVKFILSSSTNRPSGGALNTDAELQAQFLAANTNMAALGRGYQYQLTEIVDLPGVSQWFNVDVTNNKDALEAAAEAATTTYAWRSDMINVYINNDQNDSGICSFPGTGDDLIFIGQSPRATTVVHEIGHYFNLSHTHQGETYLNGNGTTCTNGCSCTQWVPGTGDAVADTLADHQCWSSVNQIAQGNFGMSYASLSAGNQLSVDRIWANIMSYHPEPRLLFTSDQLDRWTDAANSSRNAAVNGRTRFVATNGSDANAGTSTSRFLTVAKGVAVVNDRDDIVLLRAGSYNEPQTITKALTFRATRGSAVIGK